MDWTDVAWDGDKWWAFMNNVMSFHAPKKCKKCLG